MPTKKIAFLATLALTIILHAQSAEQAWLKYTSLKKPLNLPNQAEALGNSPVEQSAVAEIARGMKGLFGIAQPRAGYGSILLGTQQEFAAHGEHPPASPLAPDEYAINWSGNSPARNIEIIGGNDRAVLYGTFALLRQLATDQDISQLDLHSKPAFSIRWVDEWDNADGSIERGYAGRSIFFDAGHVREDLEPAAEYGRLLASIGINGCNVNNVNNAAPFLQPDMIKGLAKIADTMRPYGVRLSISVDIASPQKIGGLSTYDPADPAVKAWWNDKVNEIYALIPDFAGFTVKADSEGQPGPASYGRTPADAANTLAAALAPHNGIVLYRAFVYNHHLDWNDPRADRARAAYDIFHPLDGKFAPNVIVQTKEGPIDFQAREPVSPLFGGLTQTSQAMEVQITQEYTGQQRHLSSPRAHVEAGPLDFDMRVDGATQHFGPKDIGLARPAPRRRGRRSRHRPDRVAQLATRPRQSLRLRPPRMGPQHHARTHRRRVDTPDNQHRPHRHQHRRQNVDAELAHLRELYRTARSTNTH